MHKYGDWRDGSTFAAFLWAIWETVPGKLAVLCLMLLVLLSGCGKKPQMNHVPICPTGHWCTLDSKEHVVVAGSSGFWSDGPDGKTVVMGPMGLWSSDPEQMAVPQITVQSKAASDGPIVLTCVNNTFAQCAAEYERLVVRHGQ